jgi:hypothetical protein
MALTRENKFSTKNFGTSELKIAIARATVLLPPEMWTLEGPFFCVGRSLNSTRLYSIAAVRLSIARHSMGPSSSSFCWAHTTLAQKCSGVAC